MDLPNTLHAQVYALAYDRTRRRFDMANPVLFEFALRAAMLTDLYLTGHLVDDGGRPASTPSADHVDDPLLRAMLDRFGASRRPDWAQVIADPRTPTAQLVRDQLEASGGISIHGRSFGRVGSPRLAGYDEVEVNYFADRVAAALRDAIDGLPADPRPLAAGLIAALGQMSTVLTRKEWSRHQVRLRELTFAAIEPIEGLHWAIVSHFEDCRRDPGPV